MYYVVVHSDAYSLLMTWFYRHKHSSWRWFKPMWLIWFKVMMIKSHAWGHRHPFKIFEVNERENTISQLEGTWIVTRPFLSWSWWQIFTSQSFQVPRWILTLLQMYLTSPCTGLINFCKTYKNPESAWERDHRDGFKGNDNYHDVALDSSHS